MLYQTFILPVFIEQKRDTILVYKKGRFDLQNVSNGNCYGVNRGLKLLMLTKSKDKKKKV